MIRVNIVVAPGDLNWIGGRFANELVARLPQFGCEAFVNDPGRGSDLEYQQIVYGPPERRPAVGMFTHGIERPAAYAAAYDGCVAINPASLAYLQTYGARRARLFEMPVDKRFSRPGGPLFGVAGRVYSDGRKGEELVRAAQEAGFRFLAWGHGWPCEIFSSDLRDLPSFYEAIDYYVDTAYDEGGCVPALEAAAVGKPVIGHGVGAMRPQLTYERGSADSLLHLLGRLSRFRTYDDWARDHAMLFAEVLEGAR